MKIITLENLNNNYWLKVELTKFCRNNSLSSSGSKQELIKRIEIFISTGNRVKPPSKRSTRRDSDSIITRKTLVLDYKNNAATREFFVTQIGDHFHFDAYLRKFTDKSKIKPGLTYGDLVDGWLEEESKRKDPHYKTIIGKQFEFNQFTRDFFANENVKSRLEVVKAWKMVKAMSGPKTYANYKSKLFKRN